MDPTVACRVYCKLTSNGRWKSAKDLFGYIDNGNEEKYNFPEGSWCNRTVVDGSGRDKFCLNGECVNV